MLEVRSMAKQGMRAFWVGLSAGAAVAGLAAAPFFASSESFLRSSFSTALTRAEQPAKAVASTAPVSGTEEYWLSEMRRDGIGPMTKTVSVGDRITLSLGGDRRTLEVASVTDFAPQITEIDTSAKPSRFVLVTARDVSDPAARPVRFIMELEQGSVPVVTGRGGRTL
jgi:hypothetical protein